MEFGNLLFLFQLCIMLLLLFVDQSHGQQIHRPGGGTLKCFDCWYIEEQPHNTNAGFNKSCLEPNKESARNRTCTSDENSCSKIYLKLDFGNGTEMTFMSRNCTQKSWNRDFEPCSPMNIQTFTFNDDTRKLSSNNWTLSLSLALAMERLWEVAAAANIFGGGKSGRKEYNATVKEGRECLCDQKENCNNDPKMEAHDTSSAPPPPHKIAFFFTLDKSRNFDFFYLFLNYFVFCYS